MFMSPLPDSFPDALDVDSLLGPTQPARHPELRAIAISTINGSATVSGTSAAMGNPTDAALLQRVRGWADAILVGAQTARSEDYGPAYLSDGLRANRLLEGLPALPRMAVISRSLNFPPALRALHEFDPDFPPLVLTPQHSLDDESLAGRRAELTAAGVELVGAGSGSAADLVNALHARGLSRIACEGGPGIYAMMWEAELIDVLHLTLEPRVAAPVEKPLFAVRPDGGGFAHPLRLEDAQATADGRLFLRYRHPRQNIS